MWEGFNDSGMDGGILACDLPTPTKSASDVKSPTPKKIPKLRTEPDTLTNVSEGSRGPVSKVNNYSRSTHGVSFTGTCIFLKHIFFVVEFCNFYDRHLMLILVEIKHLQNIFCAFNNALSKLHQYNFSIIIIIIDNIFKVLPLLNFSFY